MLDAALRDAASRGTLALQRCSACGHVPNFPRIACPACLGELVWFDGSGRGTVTSYTVIHRPHHERFREHLPIVMALLLLEEESELISTVVGDDRLDVAIGSAVTMAPAEWSPLPQFRLAKRP